MTEAPPLGRMKTDYFFELETWLKSIESFFVLDNLALSEEQRSQLALRNYAAELGAVRGGLAHVAAVASQLLGEERRDLASFLVYLEQQRGDERAGRAASQEQNLAFAIERIHDLVRVFDEIGDKAFLSLQTYRSSGRVIVDALRGDAALEVFFSEALRPPLDPDGKRGLQRIVERIAGTRFRKELVTVLMELFKELRAVEFARVTLERPEDARRALLVFAYIHSESRRLEGYVRKRVLAALPEASALGDTLERLLFSTEMELRKVQEVVLVDALLLNDSRNLVGRFEDAHGILRDLFQQNILQLAGAFTDGINPLELFPDHSTKLEQSLHLREDLWMLVLRCAKLQEREDRRTLADLLAALDQFKHSSMRYLMFKDWANFDRYLHEFSKDTPFRSLLHLSHQFDIYLRTLVREVSKRSILATHPFRPPHELPAADTQKVKART